MGRLVENITPRNEKVQMLFDRNSVNYILRYYLPYWCAERRVGEVVDFCQATGTKQVMFMCGHQHMGWNMIPVDIARREREVFIYAGRELKKYGIRMGLNMGVTFGHCRDGWDHRKKFPEIRYWQTDINGRVDYGLPCPSDDNLKKHVKQIYQIYAECGPRYFYIDDDLRFDISRDWWGCFCESHLRSFSELTGKPWNQAELKETLYRDPLTRRQWIEHLGECIVAWAGDLREAVHEVDSNIAMGMMVPCVHLMPVFGHDLRQVLEALSGIVKPIVRPCIGPYPDNDRRQLAGGIVHMELVKHFLSDYELEYTPEIETSPFTRLSKSMTVVRWQMTEALLNGMNNPAITVAGYVGDPVDMEPEYRRCLPAYRGFFHQLWQSRPTDGTKQGVQLLYDFDSAKKSKRPIESPQELAWSSFELAKILGSLGICYTFDESPVKFLTGESVRTMTKDKIEDMLRQGLILDALAAKALVDCGYGDDIGVKMGGECFDWTAELCVNEEFNGPYVNTYIPLKAVDRLVRLLPLQDAMIVSHIVNGDREEICPGMILYENLRGGKIGVLPYLITGDGGDSRHLLCYQRRFMLRKIIEWMRPEVLPVFVEEPSDVLVQCWDDGKALTVCLTNLSYDSFSEIKVSFIDGAQLRLDQAVYVSDEGKLEKLHLDRVNTEDKSRLWFVFHHDLCAFQPLVAIIEHESQGARAGNTSATSL